MNIEFEMKRISYQPQSLVYQALEARNLLAGISFEVINGFQTVLIDGTSNADIAEVSNIAGGAFEVTFNDQTETFSANDVERIRFLGRSGDDVFTNNSSISSSAFGHNGNDILRGGSGINRIQGGNGNDQIFGGTRNDFLRGRDGDDLIDPGDRHDRVFAGDGNDTVIGSDGDDIIFGEAGDDDLRGGAGEDIIEGGEGDDTIDGGLGHDVLRGDAGADQIHGRQGRDEIFGGTGSDILEGNVGWDVIFGSNGRDTIFGHEGNDQIFGGNGIDSIQGGGGDDTIDFGGGDNDFAILDGAFGDFNVSQDGNELIVDGDSAHGTDTLANARTLRYSNIDRSAAFFDADLNEAEIESLRLLNELRESRNRRPLTAVADLSDFAEEWSREILPDDFRHSTRDEFEHLFIEGRQSFAENIVFVGDPELTSEEAAAMFHELWVNSPSHLSNMLLSDMTEVGIGLVRLSSGWYGTHNFGRT